MTLREMLAVKGANVATRVNIAGDSVRVPGLNKTGDYDGAIALFRGDNAKSWHRVSLKADTLNSEGTDKTKTTGEALGKDIASVLESRKKADIRETETPRSRGAVATGPAIDRNNQPAPQTVS